MDDNIPKEDVDHLILDIGKFERAICIMQQVTSNMRDQIFPFF